MKLIHASHDQFIFHLGRNERRLLQQVLELYPLVPVAHHQLSKSEQRPDDQRALEEAFAEQHAGYKKRVEAMLQSPKTFTEHLQGYRFTLTEGQMEWLLQVLNDVRVGSWLLLGSPENPTPTLALLNAKTMRHVWGMELASHFQMGLIAAMDGGTAGATNDAAATPE